MATDNELFIMLVAYLEAQMAISGIEVSVQQSYQPKLQAINMDEGTGEGGQVFLFKLRDKRYGWKKSYPVYNDQNPLNQEFDVISTQKMETTFQCSTLVRQDPSDVNSLTASDVLNEVVDILQSDETVDHFMKNYGVGILRVVELPQTYIIDDKDQNESEPKCEFTLEHERVRVRRVPQVKSFDAGIQRV